MSRRLLMLNVALALVSLALGVGIVRALLARRPLPAAAAVQPLPTLPHATATPPSAPGPEEYTAIVAQNLFNPSRGAAATATIDVVKPILHGIVIDGAMSRAFLEDPAVRRVGGYSIGDMIVGGKLQRIADDRVVIARPEGMVEVLLQDPSKPKPAPISPGGPPPMPGPRPDPSGAASSGPAVAAVVPTGGAPGQAVPVRQNVPVQMTVPSVASPPPQPSPSQLPQLRRRTRPGQPGNE